MDDFTDLLPCPAAQPDRPFLGMTILVVEDSRLSCETLRLMCLRSGARIRRADCLASASRHLKVYRPSAVIVDMGLPDGCGDTLIADLAAATPRVGVLLGMSGDDGARDLAMAAGADGFLAKPLENLAQFQAAILRVLPDADEPKGPRLLSGGSIQPDQSAMRDDMAHVAAMLKADDTPPYSYIAQFLSGVARTARDAPLARAAEDLGRCPAGKGRRRNRAASILRMVQERLEHVDAI